MGKRGLPLENENFPKSQTDAINVTIELFMQATWGRIWKQPVEKSQTNAISVTMHPLVQEIWGDI